jgi:hypothetical protein
MGKPVIISSTNNQDSNRSFGERIIYFFGASKLNWMGLFLFFLSASLLFSYLIAQFGFITGVILIIAMIGLPILYGFIMYPRFGIIVFLVCAYFLMFVYRLDLGDYPYGTVMDFLQLLLIIGLFIQQKQNKNWSIFKGPISTMILIWVAYNLFEVINPTAESKLAWVYTVRSVAVIMLMYFVFLYNIKTKEFIVFIVKLWISLSLIAALYGLKQQFIGFTDFENKYLYSDPEIAGLLFIGGQWRKFSIFSDPVSFSYNMVISCLLCIGLATGPLKISQKRILWIIASICLFSMLYSGTRGAYVLIPAAMIVFAILKFNKKVILVSSVFAFLLAIIVFIPTSNSTIYRFQSAFKPTEDASFNVRKQNQKRIQPFILSHPIGGGLGATGTWGKRFSPNSMLAKFPPDSGYVRVAVEMGWIGLFLFCLLMFTILRVGIHHYYAIKDPSLKSYCLAMILIVFALNIGNYPQEALVQFPTNVYFYLVTALIEVTYRLDLAMNERLNPKLS